jgi:septal ring factor EnvC (AmiA/AmiB activator)
MGRAAGQESDAMSDSSAMTMSELEDEIARREEDLGRYGEQLTRLEQEVAAVRTELDAREVELAAREAHVRARVVTLCRLRRGGYLHLLRGARSWTDLVRRARYARAIADRDLAALAEHQRQVDELAARRAELAQRVSSVIGLRERIDLYRQELEAERDRRQVSSDPLSLPDAPPQSVPWL